MSGAFLRLAIAFAAALAIVHLRDEAARVAPLCATHVVLAQDNLIPQGYYDPRSAGYGNPAAAQQGFDPNSLGTNFSGPNSPTPPTNPARPASWPGGPPLRSAPPGAAPPQAQVPLPKKDPLDPPIEPATILAHVGTEIVQASELLPTVHQIIDAYIEKNLREKFHDMPEDYRRKTRNKWEREVLEAQLKDAVNVKVLLTELKSEAPEEALQKNVEHIRGLFNQDEIKRLMTVYKASSTVDLDAKLRAQGGSLDAQRTVFVDRYLAVGWVQQQIREKRREPSHEEMVAYYRQNIAEWERPARARWEQLTAKFDQFPSQADAWRGIARWGNLVQQGVPLAEVAKTHSQAVSSDEGGLNDWTTKGSLRSEVIDRTLFTLPVGALSRILKDDDGFHILRVVEREERHTIPFSEVQGEIRDKLTGGDRQALINDYIANLRKRTPVHTVFDDDPGSLATRPGEARR